ncbi:MAG: hypothetical protein WCO95_02670 [Actinomycetes bacterium]
MINSSGNVELLACVIYGIVSRSDLDVIYGIVSRSDLDVIYGIVGRSDLDVTYGIVATRRPRFGASRLLLIRSRLSRIQRH